MWLTCWILQRCCLSKWEDRIGIVAMSSAALTAALLSLIPLLQWGRLGPRVGGASLVQIHGRVRFKPGQCWITAQATSPWATQLYSSSSAPEGPAAGFCSEGTPFPSPLSSGGGGRKQAHPSCEGGADCAMSPWISLLPRPGLGC